MDLFKCPKCEQCLPRSAFGNGAVRAPYCGPCLRAYRKEQRALKPEQYREKDRERWLKPERRAWMERRRARPEHRKYAAAKAKAWREKYPDQYKAALKEWRDKNPDRIRWHNAQRLIALQQRTPVWADQSVMEEFYRCAKAMTKVFGETWGVDHVLPLRGKKVSGLHVPANLRVCKWKDNHKKSYVYEPCP